MDENGNTTYSTTLLCKNYRKFRSARERWWFIGIASCNSKKVNKFEVLRWEISKLYTIRVLQGLDVKYKFYMKNGDRGDYWYEHFSADEFCKYLIINFMRFPENFCKNDIFFLQTSSQFWHHFVSCIYFCYSAHWFLPVWILLFKHLALNNLINLIPVELKCRQLLHTTYKLFLVSLALQTAGIMNLCMAYGNFASNGVGLPGVKLAGILL